MSRGQMDAPLFSIRSGFSAEDVYHKLLAMGPAHIGMHPNVLHGEKQ